MNVEFLKYKLQYKCLKRDKWKTVDNYKTLKKAENESKEIAKLLSKELPKHFPPEQLEKINCEFRIKKVREE